jgi:Fur family ferric uptake transcriptional regulator
LERAIIILESPANTVNLFANNSHLEYNGFMPKLSKKQVEFKKILMKSGYKATKSRLAILAVFDSAKKPLSAESVIEAVPTIDQATVYRTLKSFKEKGIIRPIDLRHNHAHYELADSEHHHHLICIQCGRIEDVHHENARALEAAVLRDSKYFSTITQHSLEFYGVCKTCARKND